MEDNLHETQNLENDLIKVDIKTEQGCTSDEDIFVQKYEQIILKGEPDNLHDELDIKSEPTSNETLEDSLQLEATNNHIDKIKNKIKNTPFKCNLCIKSFTSRSGLENHSRVHTGSRPFKCLICEKSFQTSQHLDRHNITHTGDRPKCSICQKTFSDTSVLNRHKRSHSDGKLYKCATCEKTFTQNVHLSDHMKTHTGFKPFRCDSCSYQCTTSSYLKLHMRIHTGEKPYICPHCQLCFSSSRSKTRHIQRKHT